MFDFVEATFDLVAKNDNNVERVFREISSFRQKSKQTEHVQFVSTSSKQRNFVRH